MNASYTSLVRMTVLAVPVVFLCSGPLSSQQQFSDLGRSHLPVDGESTHAVALADLDGDGYADLVAGNGGGVAEQNRIYLNDTVGGFVDVTARAMPSGLDATRDVAVGDVDGDGDTDLVFGNVGVDRLLLNDGSGNMIDMTAARLPMNNDQTWALALRDFDGDGDLDLLVVNAGQNRLLLNDGTGTFTDVTAQNLPADGSAGAGVAVGDLDGDGDLDAFIANSGPSGSQNHLYRNEGGARFVNATGGGGLPALSDDSRGVAVADVNGDRSLDIVVANHGRNVLLLNIGRMRFQDVSFGNLPVINGQSEAVLLEDVDADGDRDIVLADLGGPELLLNGGRGSFARATGSRLLPKSIVLHALAMWDTDGDSDRDLVFGVDAGGNLLYLNLWRQIDGAQPPVAGQTYRLDSYARPGFAPSGQMVATYASTGLSPRGFSLAPIGTFRLAFGGLVVGRIRPIPAGTGALAVPYAVPPAMLGMTVYLQSLFLPTANLLDARFSNVLACRIR